jgi:hypothetical protein
MVRRRRRFESVRGSAKAPHSGAFIESRTLDGNIQELIYRPTLHA